MFTVTTGAIRRADFKRQHLPVLDITTIHDQPKGNLSQAICVLFCKGSHHRSNAGGSMEGRQHLRFAARQLRRNPGFTATVIITLALSIGANTAIFSLVNALMLKSLPYPHPEMMGTIYERVTGAHSSRDPINIDGERWELLRDNVPALISAVSGGSSGANLRAGSHVQYVHTGRVSAHYLDVLALHPLIGRNFSEDEDRPQGPKAVILSYSAWRNIFGMDHGILGQAILLSSEPYVVVGVLPEGATTPLNADVYTPLQPSREE